MLRTMRTPRTCAQRQHPHRRRLPTRVAPSSLLLLECLQAGQDPGHAAIPSHNQDAQAGSHAGKQRQRGIWLLPRKLHHLREGSRGRAGAARGSEEGWQPWSSIQSSSIFSIYLI